MFKRLCCALFACLLVLPLAAQETTEYPWRAWLYNPETGEIIQVAQDGAEVGRITLPLAQAFNRYPPEIRRVHAYVREQVLAPHQAAIDAAPEIPAEEAPR